MISELYIDLRNGLEMDTIENIFEAFINEIPFSGRVTISTKFIKEGIRYQVARSVSEEAHTWDVLDKIEQRSKL